LSNCRHGSWAKASRALSQHWQQAREKGRGAQPANQARQRATDAALTPISDHHHFLFELQLHDLDFPRATHRWPWCERDVRPLKTGHLKFRPWFVCTEENTQAHALTAMLALKVRRHLERACQRDAGSTLTQCAAVRPAGTSNIARGPPHRSEFGPTAVRPVAGLNRSASGTLTAR
jgi:hypothetical protein